MAKINLLRQIIREEVIKALRQELPKLINENSTHKNGIKNVVKQFEKQQVPITLNTVDTYKKNQQFSNNPLGNLLNETAMSMQNDDIESLSFTSDNVNPVSFFQPNDVAIGDVNGMISSARPSSAIEMVQINEVPDYSNLMKKMIDKGVI